MKKFLTTIFSFSLVGIIPLLILICGYLFCDPFKVLYDYNDYSNPYVVPNRDFISTQIFLKNVKKYNYNSFIFGSSRTMAFDPDTWTRHLEGDNLPFSFDSSSESIYGIYTKLKFLDYGNKRIDNVLVIICRDQTFANTSNSKGHLFIKDPITSHESSVIFQMEFFEAYLNPSFLFSFYYYTFTHKYKEFMKGYIESREITYNEKTNFLKIIDQEREITQNPTLYYLKRQSIFYSRRTERIDSLQRINLQSFYMLHEIEKIFKKHKTNYKIVLSPLYEQIKFSKQDIKILKSLFGNNVYDFSGKNSFTDNKFNYYEPSHYRTIVGDSIMNIIYRK